MRTFFAATTIFFSFLLINCVMASGHMGPYDECDKFYQCASLESVQSETDPFKILKRTQDLSAALFDTKEKDQDCDIQNFIEEFIVRASEQTIVSTSVNPLIMDNDTRTDLRGHLDRIQGPNPISNADVAAQKEQEFLGVVREYISDKKIQLHPDFVFEFCRETIGAMSKIRRKRPQGPFFRHDIRGDLYGKAVARIIETNDPDALDYYRILTTGMGYVSGKPLCLCIWDQKGAPYLKDLEKHLGFDEEPYFKNAAEHPIVYQKEGLTAEQEKYFAIDSHFCFKASKIETRYETTDQWDYFAGHFIGKGSLKIEGESVSVERGFSSNQNIMIRTPLFQMREFASKSSRSIILDATGKIVVVAEEFYIYPDAKIHAESVEFIQIPRTEPLTVRAKKVRLFIKSNAQKSDLSINVNLKIFKKMELAIFSYIWGVNSECFPQNFPFMMQEKAYHVLKHLIWDFPRQRECERHVFNEKVQECVDQDFFSFEEGYGYQYPPGLLPHYSVAPMSDDDDDS